MTLSINSTSSNSGNISIAGQEVLSFQTDGTVRIKTSASRTSDPKTLATLETMREFMAMPKFTPFPYVGKPGFEPEGSISSSGQQVLDMMFPSMRADVLASQYYCTEEEWQLDPLKRLNCWSTGDETSWMRPPDRNGTQSGSIGGAYFGGASLGSARWGTGAGDAIRNIVGDVNDAGGSNTQQFLGDAVDASGVFSLTGKGTKAGIDGAGTGLGAKSFVFDASTVVPTADENRPKTFYGQWRIQMYGRLVRTSEMDAPSLFNAIEQVQDNLTALDNELGFIIIYPNGGTEAAPANVSINSRYVMSNPFPGYEVLCLTELFVDGKWGATGYAYSTTSGGFLTIATQLGDEIIVQTGGGGLMTQSNASGNPFNKTTNLTAATPCRVKVWKVKGLQ